MQHNAVDARGKRTAVCHAFCRHTVLGVKRMAEPSVTLMTPSHQKNCPAMQEHDRPISKLLPLVAIVVALMLGVVVLGWPALTRAAIITEPLAPVLRMPEPAKADAVKDLLEIRKYLSAKDWQHLDSALAFNHDSAQRDVNYETHYRALLDAFDTADPALRSDIDAWVGHAPGSAVAHLARATYFIEMGLAARGGAFANGTSESQFRALQDWYDLARQDLAAAKALDSTNVFVYWLQMGLAFGDGDVDDKRIMTEGLAHAPGSVLLRVRRVLLLAPRWHGSVEEMQDFAVESERAVALNPRVRGIRGFVHFDAARQFREAKKPREALAELALAFEYGDQVDFRFHRASLLYNDDQMEAALADLDVALAERPAHVEALALRSVTYGWFAQRREGEERAALTARALIDKTTAFTLDSTNRDVKWAMPQFPRLP